MHNIQYFINKAGYRKMVACVYFDIVAPGQHWTQRFGAILTVVGAYILFYDDKNKFRGSGETWSFSLNAKYSKFSMPCLIVGTILWGYRDLML